MPDPHDAFISLPALLRAPAVADVPQPLGPPAPEYAIDGVDEACAEVRRFRAALGDALELALDDLIRDIAVEIVARELRLAPCDLRAIVDRARARLEDERPLRVIVHPSEAASLQEYDVAVEGDESLMRGDARIELRAGTIDARLGVRLQSVLAR